MYIVIVGVHVLLVALGSAGDVHPNIGLALALRDRGHRVTLVASGAFQRLADRHGFEFFPVGSEEEFYTAVRNPDLWHPRRAIEVVARCLILRKMRPLYELIADNYRPGETVVAAPGTAFGARLAEEKLGVPLASVHLQPSMIRSYFDPMAVGVPDIMPHLPVRVRRWFFHLVDRAVIDRLLAAEVNQFRAELGLQPERRLFERWLHSPQLVVGLFPDWFGPPQRDWPPNVHPVGFPLFDESDTRPAPPELDAFLAAGPHPIVFTAGSAMAHARDFFYASVEVCRRLGRRGVLLTQFPEQLPARLPDTVARFDYVPFSRVLPRAAALVHHGGIGTTAQAFSASVPQLVVPLAHDQFDNAARVQRLGAGKVLAPKRYSVRSATRALDQLLASAPIRNACAEYARRLSPGAAIESACQWIETLAGRDAPKPDGMLS